MLDEEQEGGRRRRSRKGGRAAAEDGGGAENVGRIWRSREEATGLGRVGEYRRKLGLDIYMRCEFVIRLLIGPEKSGHASGLHLGRSGGPSNKRLLGWADTKHY
jgi:hypothetical protein